MKFAAGRPSPLAQTGPEEFAHDAHPAGANVRNCWAGVLLHRHGRRGQKMFVKIILRHLFFSCWTERLPIRNSQNTSTRSACRNFAELEGSVFSKNVLKMSCVLLLRFLPGPHRGRCDHLGVRQWEHERGVAADGGRNWGVYADRKTKLKIEIEYDEWVWGGWKIVFVCFNN